MHLTGRDIERRDIMKDSGEVFENVKEQATQHEAKKRRRNRIGTVAAVLLVVAAVGISVSVYKKTNSGKKPKNWR